MKAAILIVGEDGVLSHARVQMLKDCWETVTEKSVDPQVALHARTYDLLVFSKTVPDGVVKAPLTSTTESDADARSLVISEEGQQRPLGHATFTAEFFKPDRLRQKVARLLDGE